MKGTPPVSDTDVCLISTTLKEDNTAYILSSSVDSHLVPDVLGFRTKIDLQGFALRRLEHAPIFEAKEIVEVEHIRPSHKRNQSSASIGLFSSLTLSGENSVRSASNSVSTPAGTPFLSVPSLPTSKRSSTCEFWILEVFRFIVY